MNNSRLEQAFAEWLIATGISTPVHAGSSPEQISNDAPTIIVSVPEMLHVVGPLHKATVRLIVSAPAYHTALDAYRQAAAELRDRVRDHQTSNISSHLTAAGFTLGGIFVQDSGEQIEDSRWINTLSLTVGLSEAGEH
jgi:hypothetical protein